MAKRKVDAKNHEATVETVKAYSNMQNQIDKAIQQLIGEETVRPTIQAFGECVHGYESLKKKLKEYVLNNQKVKDEKPIRLNLVWLTFDFLNQAVTIEYYVEDPKYPPVVLPFEEFIKLLSVV